MIFDVAVVNISFDATTRGLRLRPDDQGAFRLHWIPLIYDEMSRALADTGRKADLATVRRHEALMQAALP